MPEDWSELERQLNREAETLADLWPVPCPPGLRDQLREAVRLEMNEQWLPSPTDPTPEAPVLDRVHRAVRQELALAGGSSHGGPRVPALWMWGVSGVAATVALVLGVLWYGDRAEVASTPPAAPNAPLALASGKRLDPVELFAQAAQQVWTQDPLMGELRSNVQAMEEQVMQGPREDGVEQLIEQIDVQIEEMFDQWPSISDDNA